MHVSIKNIDDKIFREFKAESVKEGLHIGKSLTYAMKLWIEQRKKEPRMNLLNLKPVNWGKGTERISEEIDEILY